MDTILLVITVLSLAAAVVMSAAAWRLARDERARSAARIAALTAAADANDEEPNALDPWGLNQPARVTASAAPAVQVDAPWAPAHVSVQQHDAFLGSSLVRPSNGGQRGLAIAAAVLFVIVLVGGYFTVFSDRSTAARAAASAGTEVPLELVSLRHERRNGGLAITGLVRNPTIGLPVQDLAAVVLLFDQKGTLVTSARSAVDFTTLAPGDESPFVVTLNAPSNVARYRVSFRNDTSVVAHIDRRGQEPIARDTP